MGTANTENFFAKIWNGFLSVFSKAKAEASLLETKLATYANAVTNEIKVLESNATVNDIANILESVVEAADPAIAPLINDLKLYVPKVLNLLTGVTAEIDKPIEQEISDALAKLAAIKGIDGTIWATLIAGLNAAILGNLAGNNGVTADATHLITTGLAEHALAA